MPDNVIAQPANVATPDVAASGFVVHDNTPPPGFVPIANVTLALDDVTVFPPASCTLTTGCVAHAEPPVPPPGWVVNANFDAAPTVTLNVLDVAVVSPADVAVSV